MAASAIRFSGSAGAPPRSHKEDFIRVLQLVCICDEFKTHFQAAQGFFFFISQVLIISISINFPPP